MYLNVPIIPNLIFLGKSEFSIVSAPRLNLPLLGNESILIESIDVPSASKNLPVKSNDENTKLPSSLTSLWFTSEITGALLTEFTVSEKVVEIQLLELSQTCRVIVVVPF